MRILIIAILLSIGLFSCSENPVNPNTDKVQLIQVEGFTKDNHYFKYECNKVFYESYVRGFDKISFGNYEFENIKDTIEYFTITIITQ